MSGIRKCAIYGCNSNSRDHKDLKFFKFPSKDSPFYKSWLSSCHESVDVIRSLRYPRICSNHFRSLDMGDRRLLMGAVPRLFLKTRPSSLINKCVFEWIKRAQYHPDFGKPLCTTGLELQRIGKEIRNLVGATLTYPIDGSWLRKFRWTYLSDWDHLSNLDLDGKKVVQSLDLIEIIKSIDPNAKISNEEEIAILVEKEKQLSTKAYYVRDGPLRKPSEHCPSLSCLKKRAKCMEAKKRSFKEALEEFYGIESKNNSHSDPEVKLENVDLVDLSQDDDGCFDVNSEDSGQVVGSEPIVETDSHTEVKLEKVDSVPVSQEDDGWFNDHLEDSGQVVGSETKDETNSNSDIEAKLEKVDSVDVSKDKDGCFDVISENSGQVVSSEPIVETDSHTEVKLEKVDSVPVSQEDDGCFNDHSQDSGQVVGSELIVETYQQALALLKPLEDFALRQEDYRVIGLLSTLEIIFKNKGSTTHT